ncbi:MAG: DUF3883 domain-containing protein [Anaerolineales bacterium]|nr:DUF3883 domain-containing protein [Anaerolineales bacterium]
MAKLEEIKYGSVVEGLLPKQKVTVIDAKWLGDTLEVVYRDHEGGLHTELLFRSKEHTLTILEPGTQWAFDSQGDLFRLASEATRIRMAYLFDPWMAVHLSIIDPLPHQISAVYEHMLIRQPLRYLLADDPGAGKTIMAGLYVKELMLRGDLERCLIVAPGNLTEQWQDELYQKFRLEFEIFTNARFEAARDGNAFTDVPLGIARLDWLSRNADYLEMLKRAEWDLVIFDEAHKLSASVFAGEISYTKRYRLGQALSQQTRHLLLMTATPHNGKEEDFQLFMALLDPDRFEGKYREGHHSVDAHDLMRRMVKEKLLRFDGTRLFPERRAYTVNYKLSDLEAILYEQVTNYVREEFNRAEQLDKEKRGTVGFALMILQRRLASSPEAIYQSLQRRRQRLEDKLREETLLQRGAEARAGLTDWANLDAEELENIDEIPDEELEALETEVSDMATSARTIEELQAEILILKDLEKTADKVRRSKDDRKWAELSRLLQEQNELFDASGLRRKLVIFTEHRDTLNYLVDRIRTLLGKPEAVVAIHGGMLRDERRRVQSAFVQDKDVSILVATDAAGEGINLQRAHLMVNYDLPWNPTRLEQRFGRIHRIGQREVCHLWNLVANETREGYVYSRLLEKIEEQRRALNDDAVFDVLGELFREQSLRELLVQAVRYGDREDVRARLFEAVDNITDQNKVRALLEDQLLAGDVLDTTRIQSIREDFERATAKRLQPHFVASFFAAAFEILGGAMHPREPRRYEITHVPGAVRERARLLGRGQVLERYERATFHKEDIDIAGKPTAEFLTPGHALVEAVQDILLERYGDLLKRGALLLDPNDLGEEPRALFYLEHSIQDGRPDSNGERRVISRQMQFVEMDAASNTYAAGAAPFLDYQPIPPEFLDAVRNQLSKDWLQNNFEERAIEYAVANMVPAHFEETSARREEMVRKTAAAVKERLTKEIQFWDRRAEDLKAQEQAGKRNAKLNSEQARRRANDLQARLERRLEELEQERQLVAQKPRLLGGALVIPRGMLDKLGLTPADAPAGDELFGAQRRAVELAAMQAVMEHERSQGHEPVDVSAQNLGWDIESHNGAGGLAFIEVKGRIASASTVTLTRNEILAGLNQPEKYVLALVKVDFVDDQPVVRERLYFRPPFEREPDFAATSVNYKIAALSRMDPA